MTVTWHPRYTDTRNPRKAIVVRPAPHNKAAAVELRLSNRATTMHLSHHAKYASSPNASSASRASSKPTLPTPQLAPETLLRADSMTHAVAGRPAPLAGFEPSA